VSGGLLRRVGREPLLGEPLAVAEWLLGKLLVVEGRIGRITEVEAYGGRDDPASHAYRGESARNRTMFAAGGHLYVYLAYGLHHCANVACGPSGEPAAVLVRSVAPGPLPGGVGAVGPGRVCRVLGIDRGHDGRDLVEDADVHLADDGFEPATVLSGPRVGLSPRSGAAAHWPWRLWVPASPDVPRLTARGSVLQ
jgi:DNA-3-methyladenine glycosylase